MDSLPSLDLKDALGRLWEMVWIELRQMGKFMREEGGMELGMEMKKNCLVGLERLHLPSLQKAGGKN